jgi:hypothetical protein
VLAACTPPRAPRPPIAEEPVRSAEEIASEHRALSHEDRVAAIGLTIERFLTLERQTRGADATLTVVLENVAEADAPPIAGVTYTALETIRTEAAQRGPIFYLAIGPPAPSSARDLVTVPIERRAAPVDGAAGDSLFAAGDCAVHVPAGAAPWLQSCHYDVGHEGD